MASSGYLMVMLSYPITTTCVIRRYPGKCYPIPSHPNTPHPILPQVFIIDANTTSAATVAAIKARGRFPVCYFRWARGIRHGKDVQVHARVQAPA